MSLWPWCFERLTTATDWRGRCSNRDGKKPGRKNRGKWRVHGETIGKLEENKDFMENTKTTRGNGGVDRIHQMYG